uniref:EGF-like domain-containing protein n=1 Tax=Steinernema glaseri TaxID=37863 RepID=A0A1I7Y9Z2_9BILA
MTERVTHLTVAAFILLLSFLSSTAVVPAPGQCWEDRIVAFSGTIGNCNVTKRCVNETYLLDRATKECGQRPNNHTFQESCGEGQFFAIDYTCCAPYKYHEQCLKGAQWNQEHTDTLLTAMQKSASLAKTMHAAREFGDHATADKIKKEQLRPTLDLLDHKTPFDPEPTEDITGCTNKSGYKSYLLVVLGMTERVTYLTLAAFILLLSFLSSTAIVPAPGQCWKDRIVAFSDHEQCLKGAQWNQEHTDTLLTAMQKSASLAKSMHAARELGDRATADKIKKEQLRPTLDILDHKTPFDQKPTEDITGCTNRTFGQRWARNSTVSRHRTLFEFREDIQRSIFFERFHVTPNVVLTLLESKYDCTKVESALTTANPDPNHIAKKAYANAGGCSFFPEVEKRTVGLTFELYRNTSMGLTPTEKSFWRKENATARYCEWLVEKLTDPKWAQEESHYHLTATFIICPLILIGSVFVAAVVGFIYGKRNPQKKLSSVVYRVFRRQ